MGKGFGIEETVLDGVPYQVIYHFFWDDGQRNRLYAAIGFIVNLDELKHGGRFNQLVTTGLETGDRVVVEGTQKIRDGVQVLELEPVASAVASAT